MRLWRYVTTSGRSQASYRSQPTRGLRVLVRERLARDRMGEPHADELRVHRSAPQYLDDQMINLDHDFVSRWHVDRTGYWADVARLPGDADDHPVVDDLVGVANRLELVERLDCTVEGI